ncbi:MAG: hypothetical protein ACREBS_06730 [Nitrososphaerales archaeon]
MVPLTNLFKIDLSAGGRSDHDIHVVKQVSRMRFVEYLLAHEAYAKRFGYD